MVNIIVSLISFLGLPLGIIISKYTKEEIHNGKKYLVVLKEILLIAIAITFIYYSRKDYLILSLGILLGIIFYKSFKQIYFYLGFAAAVSFINPVLILSLIFIYGLPHGSLLYEEKAKNLKASFIWFLIPLLILFIDMTTPSVLGIVVAPISGIVIGGLSYSILKCFTSSA